jgi:hypothetical protein
VARNGRAPLRQLELAKLLSTTHYSERQAELQGGRDGVYKDQAAAARRTRRRSCASS